MSALLRSGINAALKGLSPSKDQIVSFRSYLLSRFAILVVFYLLSFLLLAVIRVFTGISIKRLGYLSLCHISFSPSSHVTISIRKIGLSFHRPTFLHPGWVSLYISDLDVSIDSDIVAELHSKNSRQPKKGANTEASHHNSPKSSEDDENVFSVIPHNSVLFYLLKFALIYGKYFDFKATNSSFTLNDVGSLLVGNLDFKLDFRKNSSISDVNKFIGTLDSHKFKPGEAPAWIRLLVQDVFFSPGDRVKDSKGSQLELFDFFVMDSRGVVDQSNLAIKDFSVSCRFGVVNIQADQVLKSITSFMDIKAQVKSSLSENLSAKSDSAIEKPFFASLLTSCVRVFKEVEFKVTSFSVYKAPLDSYLKKQFPDYTVAFTFKDFSLDLRRLNSKSPAFRLFFSDEDSAHQAIWTCSSLMIGLDHNGVQEELIYIPLITAISKTNIFSKTINFLDQTVEDRNKTILRSNINVTTPSVNIEPHHIGLLFAAFLSPHDKGPSMKDTTSSFQKLWPRAVVKFTIDEPATRVLVHKPEGINAPIPYAKLALSKELSGMVVCSCSKVHCDFESSHVDDKNGNSKYSFQAVFQLSAFEAWYRSSEGLRFDFLNNDSLSLQLSAALSPALTASISGQVKSLRLLSIHSEVLYGIREVLRNFKQYQRSKPVPPGVTETEFAVRKLPEWLRSITFEIDSVTVAIAADELEHYISTSRGVKFMIAKIRVNYHAKSTPSVLYPKVTYTPTDHRLAELIVQGISGYKIMGLYHENDKLENKFLDIPNFGASIATDRDIHGPISQFDFDVPSIFFHWDPNFQYVLSLCLALVGMSFMVENRDKISRKQTKKKDFINLNYKFNFVKIKATLPENVLAILELNSILFKVGHDSYTKFSASVVRFYTEHPTIANALTRVITIRKLDVDIKDLLKNLGKPSEHNSNEQILITSDAIRLNVAYQLVVHKLIDNLITGFKSIITLTNRALLNQPKYIFPLSEKDKMPNIPKIRIKSNNIMLTFEDDLFESKLGLIFQVGLREQKKRLEGEAAFEAKLEAIKAAKNSTSKEQPPVETHAPSVSEEPTKANNSFVNESKVDVRSTNQASVKETIVKNSEKKAQGFHKIIHTNTFRNFQNSIHPFHSSIRRHKPDDNASKFKMTDIEEVSKEAQVEIETARYRLDKMFSDCWIKAYNTAEENLKASISEQLKTGGLDDHISSEMASQERIVEYSPFPFLFFLVLSKVDWFLSKPNMSDSEMRDFLHDVGKGFPKDRNFSILIPLYNQLQCDAIRAQLRDYPLPLLYFPHLNLSQSSDLPSINIQGNFIIAEDFSLLESNIRRVFVPVDPLVFDHYNYPNSPAENPFIVEVHRTVASIKMYTNLSFDIRTMNPSVITWCVSMQPAMQAFMQVFDLFSKPPLDPSEKIGFWDKIRSVFHARFTFKWTEGDVHLKLKGSSNPYCVIGDSAGFVMCWRNNVVMRINPDDDPKKFVTVNSNDYVLAIPNFSFQEREYLSKSFDKSGGLACSSNFFESTIFQKVIMKLRGRVTWTAGLLFERKKGHTGRTFKFKPHYDVVLCNPTAIKDLTSHDAYRGFRADFLHLAISVVSTPQDDDEFVSYNSIHLTPKFFAHFFKWWDLFDGALSLPIRAGPLFQSDSDTEMKPKKFGRHLFTVKYQLHLTPFFATHGYVHTSYNDEKKTCSHTVNGLKAKVDEFVMDLHQRRSQAGPGKRWKMGLNVGELDFIGSDLRVVTASFTEKSHEELLAKNLGVASSSSSSLFNTNNSSTESNFSNGKFNISDNDLSWIDPDDYVEVGESSYSSSSPKITIMPLSYTPRWTYFRQTDHGICASKTVLFGNEPSHTCLIGKDQSVSIRQDLLKNRLVELEEQLKTNETMLESLQKNLDEFPNTAELAERIAEVKENTNMIRERIGKVSELLGLKNATLDKVQVAVEHSANEITKNLKRRKQSVHYIDDAEIKSIDSAINDIDDMPADENSFNNVFIIHSTQIKWNNSVRNAMFRYLHRVAARRSGAYFLTQRAVKYLDDLIKKQESCKTNPEEVCMNSSEIHEALDGLLSNLRAASSIENLRESSQSETSENSLPDNKFYESMRKTSNQDYVPTDTYLVRLVTPQIQLISDQNPNQCVLVTSETIDLKIVTINDSQREDDEESQLVETRYGVSLHDAQFFVLNQEKIKSGMYTLFSSNSYGCSKEQIWPPWVSVECCYDSTPLKQALIIEKTSVTLRYDMPNSLRVQAGERADSLKKTVTAALIRDDTHRQNRMSVNFPKVVASCDSEQFFATFTVIMDLLIYTEPMQKERSERIDKVLLATDFSNLELAAKRVIQLQTYVRNFQELRKEFLAHVGELNNQAIINLARIEVEQEHARQELFVMMQAISSAMRKVSRDDDTTQLLKWTLGADQVIWHVLDEKHEPFLDVGLANASFNRIEGSDGFNANSIEIGMIQAFNLSPNTFYPEMISPYLEKGQEFSASSGNVVSINWTMLDPIGGIPIVQKFDIKLKPVKVQLESKSWNMIFNYIFPKNAEGKADTESPFLLSQIKKGGDTVSTMDDSFDSDSDSQSLAPSVENTTDDTVSALSEVSSVFKKPGLHFRKIMQESSSSSITSRSNSNRRALRDPSPASSTRSSTNESFKRTTSTFKRLGYKNNEEKPDELSEMMNRASKYLSIVQIRIVATVLCISFKGEGVKNLLDVHEFRLNLPEIQYENKTWSNIDLVLHLKRDVIKILLNHTGGLIGNKLKKHRKKRTNLKLNQLTNYVAFTPVSNLADDSSSTVNHTEGTISNENEEGEDNDSSGKLNGAKIDSSPSSRNSSSLLKSPSKTSSFQSAASSRDSGDKKKFLKRLF